MKRIAKIRFLLSKNKQARKALALVCLVLVMLGGIFTSVKILDEKEKVSAHPTNTIKLDEGGANEFEVPVDATSLIEPSLTSQSPLYDDFVQTNSDLPTVVKGEISSFWSDKVYPEGTGGSSTILRNVSWSIQDVQPTEGGNYFVLLAASGQTVGGVIGVCVVNPLGECIYMDAQGNLRNANDRVNTRIFSTGNGKDFLIGTNGNNFYRYTISSESSSSAVVNREPLSVDSTNSPNAILGVGYYQIVDSVSNNNDRTDVIGTVYYDDRNAVNASSAIPFKMPIADISINGWMDSVNPSFSFDTNYQYSIDTFVPQGAESTSGKKYGFVASTNTVITNNHVYGTYNYTQGADGGINMKTIQVFDKNDTFYENGKPVKRRKVLYENQSSNSRIYLLNELCTESEIYFVSTEETESKLIKVELSGTYDIQVIKTYPVNTILNFVENPDDSNQLFYFGSTGSLTGEFYHPVLTGELTGNNFYIQGITNKSFTRQSMYAIATNGYILPDFMKQGDNKALIFGGTPSTNSTFVDIQYQIGETGNISENSPDELTTQAFIGSVESQSDFAPIIKAENNIAVNLSHERIDSTERNTNGWTFLDNWLITGEEDGTLSSTNAVSVYDYQDSRDNNFGQDWLNRRINRNPRNSSAAIDWEKLGFDKTKAGAQQVTYFVTDSQNQTSVTSRWVNKKTNQTVEEADYCLDAQNFHIPLAGLDSAIPNDATFKRLAKTMAWEKTSHDIDEDGTDATKLSNLVTIDATQLQALRDATEAKPYPVDVTYTPESGVELTNRVWVFVTEDNTVPNSEVTPDPITPADTNGVVIYANDYSLPFRNRNVHTNLEAVTNANVKVYDYFDSTHETDDELPTLADATKNASEITVDLQTIQDATEPETVRPSVSYTWQGTTDANHTNGTASQTFVNVELTGNALLHIRQVVLDASNEIVVPTKGYVDIRNRLFVDDWTEPTLVPDYRSNLVVESGNLANEPNFTTIAISVDHLTHMGDVVQLSLVAPEFYEYVGNWCTAEAWDPDGASHSGSDIYIDGNLWLPRIQVLNEGEFWITLFIKPNVDENDNIKTPQPYSWDYKKNDLGKIKTITP